MLRIFLWLACSLALCAGCARPSSGTVASTPASPTGVSGVWKGELPASEQGKGPASSQYLAKELGGYTLKLQDDGQFLADWRGLTFSGTWAKQGETVALSTMAVFGKTKAQAEQENKATGKTVNDMGLYDQKFELAVAPDGKRLTLNPTESSSQSVVFHKE